MADGPQLHRCLFGLPNLAPLEARVGQITLWVDRRVGFFCFTSRNPPFPIISGEERDGTDNNEATGSRY